MEKETKTRNSVIGCLVNIKNSIMLTSKSLLGNEENNDIDEIKSIDEYEPGELSEDEQILIESLKREETALKRKLEKAKSNLQRQVQTGNRVTNLRMQIIEKEHEK